jgi:hypothetical protein
MIKDVNRIKIVLVVTSLCCVNFMFSQPTLPPRSITVTATQSIQFGTFLLTGGAGGTVTVGWDGSRTATGSVALLDVSPFSQPAIFEIKLLQGRNVSISFSPTVTLTGSKGGYLNLHIGPTEKGSNGAVFSTDNSNRDFVTSLRVGGTLDVPGGAIPGNYTGTFFITFNQE